MDASVQGTGRPPICHPVYPLSGYSREDGQKADTEYVIPYRACGARPTVGKSKPWKTRNASEGAEPIQSDMVVEQCVARCGSGGHGPVRGMGIFRTPLLERLL